MAAFHDVRFPLSIGLGAVGGPERVTEVVGLVSGRERRNAPQALSRRRWIVGSGVKSRDDLYTLLSFFEARRGRLHGFLWRDPLDHQSCPPTLEPGPFDQPLGLGDGARRSFQLIKRYGGGDDAVERPIHKPVPESVRIGVDGAELGEGWSVEAGTGVVTFETAPAPNAVLSAGFAFDVPARFDVDRLDVSLDAFRAGEAASIPIVEILV